MKKNGIYEREVFLEIRRIETAEAKRHAEKQQKMGINFMVLDAEDDIFCDFCNNEVLDEVLYIHDWHLLCYKCREKHKLL